MGIPTCYSLQKNAEALSITEAAAKVQNISTPPNFFAKKLRKIVHFVAQPYLSEGHAIEFENGQVIYKRNTTADWAQFAEIFGMPIQEYIYDTDDDDARQ